MSARFGEVSSRPTQSPYANNPNNGDAGDFECNICYDLAQDPIVTLCGHLFCWPCLYKWLHIHSLSQECPVCKAQVEEAKLVPLYGRGKDSTNRRSRPIPDVEIPHRPVGQRPETAPPPDRNAFGQHGFGLTGGSGPAVTTSLRNYNLSFGGLVESFFNAQTNAFTSLGQIYGNGAHHHHHHHRHAHGVRHHQHHHHHQHAFGVPRQRAHHHEIEFSEALPLLIIGFLFLAALILS